MTRRYISSGIIKQFRQDKLRSEREKQRKLRNKLQALQTKQENRRLSIELREKNRMHKEAVIAERKFKRQQIRLKIDRLKEKNIGDILHRKRKTPIGVTY